MNISIEKSAIEQFLIESNIKPNPTTIEVNRAYNTFLKNRNSAKTTPTTKFILYWLKQQPKEEIKVEVKVEVKEEKKQWITDDMEKEIESNKNKILENNKNQITNLVNQYSKKENLIQSSNKIVKINKRLLFLKSMLNKKKSKSKSKDNIHKTKFNLVLKQMITVERNNLKSISSFDDEYANHEYHADTESETEPETEPEPEPEPEPQPEPQEDIIIINKYILEETDGDYTENLHIFIENTNSKVESVLVSYDEGETYEDEFGIYYYSDLYGDYIIENKVEGSKNPRIRKDEYRLENGIFKLI